MCQLVERKEKAYNKQNYFKKMNASVVVICPKLKNKFYLDNFLTLKQNIIIVI